MDFLVYTFWISSKRHLSTSHKSSLIFRRDITKFAQIVLQKMKLFTYYFTFETNVVFFWGFILRDTHLFSALSPENCDETCTDCLIGSGAPSIFYKSTMLINIKKEKLYDCIPKMCELQAYTGCPYAFSNWTYIYTRWQVKKVIKLYVII